MIFKLHAVVYPASCTYIYNVQSVYGINRSLPLLKYHVKNVNAVPKHCTIRWSTTEADMDKNAVTIEIPADNHLHLHLYSRCTSLHYSFWLKILERTIVIFVFFFVFELWVVLYCFMFFVCTHVTFSLLFVRLFETIHQKYRVSNLTSTYAIIHNYACILVPC